MKEDVFRIGQEIKCVEGFEIECPISLTKMTVRQGDKAYVDSHGNIHYITGVARGKIELANLNTKGYDHENIAELLFKMLRREFPIDQMMDDYEIEKNHIVNEIEYLLSDIL